MKPHAFKADGDPMYIEADGEPLCNQKYGKQICAQLYSHPIHMGVVERLVPCRNCCGVFPSCATTPCVCSCHTSTPESG